METDQHTPVNDERDSRLNGASASIFPANCTFQEEQAGPGADDEFQFRGVAASKSTVNSIQTATPPTTGSPDIEEYEKIAKRANYSGMNPERMRQLGLLDGADD